MLGFIFGFNARLGRLAYFLSCIAFGVGIMVLGVLLISGFRQSGSPGVPHHPGMAMIVSVVVLVVLALWLGTCLLSMRVRDMGWNPAVVIPAFWVILAVVAYVAALALDWATPGAHYGTIFGSSINFLFNVAVMFWPSAGYDTSVVGIPDTFRPRSEPAMRTRDLKTAPAEPAAPVSRQASPGRKTFGRLGQQH